ncbi:class I SAM-dependent methyltransferase family protein [Candidatus Berkelbacteria bacterium]|nr:class I SAM-dependent methyltransferase family protein [Candidatus Berkelbacteria bacterium]
MSIPARLRQEGKAYLIPLYHLLRTSHLAREAIEASGSHEFADHVYGNQPSGRWGIGYLLDALFLNLPSARSFRNRYYHAQRSIETLVRSRSANGPLHILAAPSGLAREFFVSVGRFRSATQAHEHVRWYALDGNPEVVTWLQARASRERIPLTAWSADALEPSTYQDHPKFHAVVSLGLTEFLNDEDVVRFFRVIRNRLEPGGQLITSSMLPHPLSDFLMRELAELHTHYRDAGTLEDLAKQAGYEQIQIEQDSIGLQSLMKANV